MHSPLVESLEVTRYGSVRRAKLYYLRGLQGRAARIKEQNPLQRRRAAEAAKAAVESLAAQAVELEKPAEELEVVDEAPVDELGEESLDEADVTSENEVEDQEAEVAEGPAVQEPEDEALDDPEKQGEEEPPDESGEDLEETEDK